MNLTSRVLQFMPLPLLVELNNICKDVTISDNNTKVNKIVKALDKYDVDYSELGPGTNRFAILIDGYVFKIAMDRLGVQDNWAEFSLTQELQPFVIKVYECNGLIIVTEYVTVISKEEFIKKKDEIRRILSTISDRYLLGDVGTVSKNFMNWGYRDNGDLTILDFAYIYRIQGEEMICGGKNKAGDECKTFLNYDENFHGLICPSCGKKYSFTDIRIKIDPQYEKMEVDMIKQVAELVTKPRTETGIVRHAVETQIHPTVNEIYDKGDDTMSKHKDNVISDEEFDSLFDDALNFVKNHSDNVIPDDEIIDNSEEPLLSDIQGAVTLAETFDDDVEEDDSSDEEYDEDRDKLEYEDVYVASEESDINDLVEEKMFEEEFESEESDNIDESNEHVGYYDIENDGSNTISDEYVINAEASVVCKEPVDVESEESISDDDEYQNESWPRDEDIGFVEDEGPTSSINILPEELEGDLTEVSDSNVDEHIDKSVDVEVNVDVIREVGETVEVEVVVDDNKTTEQPTSFIQVFEPEDDNISDDTSDDMRNELRNSLPEECDDEYDDQYEDLYNQNVRTNQNLKYNGKRRSNRMD